MVSLSDIKKQTYGLKFPDKLWTIVNECSSGAIGWGLQKNSIAVNKTKFQEEFLNTEVFKTSNVTSFIRQLNLYGFRKCNRYEGNMHEFKHPMFVRGRKDLLEFVTRSTFSPYSPKYRTPERRLKDSKICDNSKTLRKKNKLSNQDAKYESNKENTPKKQLPETIKTTAAMNSKRLPLSYLQELDSAVSSLWWDSYRSQNAPWNHLAWAPAPSNICPTPTWNCDGTSNRTAPSTPKKDTASNQISEKEPTPDEIKSAEGTVPPKEPVKNTVGTGIGPNGNRPVYFLVLPALYHPGPALYPNCGFYNGIIPLPNGGNPEGEPSRNYSNVTGSH